MAKRFLLRRKGVALDVVGPVTEEEAKDIAGYPGEFEKVAVEGEPNRAGYDTNQDGSKKAKASDPAMPAGVEPAPRAARATTARATGTKPRKSRAKARTATSAPSGASTASPASTAGATGGSGATTSEG